MVDKDRNELNLIDEKDNGKSSASKTADKARKRGGEEEPEQPMPQKSKQNKEQKAKPQQLKEPEKEPAATDTRQPAGTPVQPKQPKPKRQPKPKPAKEDMLLLPAADGTPDVQPEAVVLQPVSAPEVNNEPATDATDTAVEVEETTAPSETKPRPKRRHHRRKPRQQGDQPAEAVSDETSSDE